MRKVRSGSTLAERIAFYSVPVTECGCFIWIGAVNDKGYGQLGVGKRSTIAAAHRLAFELKNGPIPEGMYLCHRCDIPACVNPDHLFVGSALDNSRDMVAKNRGRKGHKLSREDVKTIRSSTCKAVELARSYGVSESLVSRVKNMQVYRNLV